jgi:hypothetical protein
MRAQDARTLAIHVTAVATATTSAPYTGQAPTLSEWLTFDAFLKRFKARWISSNNRMEAITKIAKVKQMGSVMDYNSAFVTVAYNMGSNDTALIPYYRMGLKPAVLMRILSSETFKGTTIVQWVDKATAVNDIWQIAMGNKGGGSNFSKAKKRKTMTWTSTWSKRPKERERHSKRKEGVSLK